MEWIKCEIGWKTPAQQFEPKLTIPGLVFDAAVIEEELLLLTQKIPCVPWRSQEPGALYGLSLSYNPQASEHEWHCGSFGHPRYRRFSPQAYFTVPEFDREHARRGDYLDSLGFRCLLPQLAQLPHLSNLLHSFRMPVVRCTLRIIDGQRVCASQDDEGGMHRDDPPFEMLRVNLCITSSENFGLQYIDQAPIILQPGAHSVINSDTSHRVWIKKRSDFRRMHLIVGLVPWLNYDVELDAWSPNAHFGNTHPYDLVRQGQIMRTP